MNGGGQSSALWIAGDELDVLNSTALPFRQRLFRDLNHSPIAFSAYEPTSGIRMVLMIDLSARFHRRRVLSEILPRLGFKIESGTIKSEVRMIFLFQSTLRPWGLKLSASMLAFDAASFGCSAMMLNWLSVSTSRPGEVPAAAVEC